MKRLFIENMCRGMKDLRKELRRIPSDVEILPGWEDCSSAKHMHRLLKLINHPLATMRFKTPEDIREMVPVILMSEVPYWDRTIQDRSACDVCWIPLDQRDELCRTVCKFESLLPKQPAQMHEVALSHGLIPCGPAWVSVILYRAEHRMWRLHVIPEVATPWQYVRRNYALGGSCRVAAAARPADSSQQGWQQTKWRWLDAVKRDHATERWFANATTEDVQKVMTGKKRLKLT